MRSRPCPVTVEQSNLGVKARMFQNFDSVSDPSLAKTRVAALRALFGQLGIDGFLVPRTDEHQGEYVASRAERLRWLTGFSGSAGIALILAEEAHVFVDGRYTLQVREQTDPAIFQWQSLVDLPPAKFLAARNLAGLTIGFDPWLHTIGEVRTLRAAVEEAGGLLKPLPDNPVDAIWTDQPGAPLEAVTIHDERFAGRLARDKLAELADMIGKAKCSHAVLTDPSSLAWAFNIRGSDVPHTPLALGFAILAADGNHLVFMDKRKLPMVTEAYMTQLCTLRPPSALESDLAALAGDGAVFGLDPVLCTDRVREIAEAAGGKTIALADPARLPRAMKNATEIEGARAAHRRDGAALCEYLAWMAGQPEGLDEIGAATRLEAIRASCGERFQAPLKDVSFDTISGAGPNGAIMHYRVTRATSRKIRIGELFLVDSGAQYEDGTTDVTRTMVFGAPSAEQRARYTMVLKGLIAISLIRFPPGTRGMDIDVLARRAHWMAGLDFAHGTGHGVGSYLSVHEGPQRIARTGVQELKEGMILSNEPGYYKEGAYGIRLENLIVVTPPETIAGGEIAMHSFETLTLAPFERALIDTALLTREELQWLDAYHARVLAEIGPVIDAGARSWLETACAGLG